MQNLLPTVPNKLEETLSRVDRISNWHQDDADPVKAKIDRKLISQFTVDKVEVIKYRQSQVPKPEPNYVSPIDIGSVGPSPLNAAVRAEEVEETVINMEGMRVDSGIPALIKPKKKKVVTKFDHFLFTKFYSKMPIVTDLYVQKLRTMKVLVLKPFDELLRLIEGDPKHAEFVGYNGVHVLCSPLMRSTVAMTTRREIKDYHFNKYDRIGLEVEMVDGKLTCTRVIPGTQAAPHSLYLNSAEIVGVNGERVLTLEEFQKAMQRAKQERFFLGEIPDEKEMEAPIILTVAAFKGGKSKIDDVFLHSFAQRERMKSLFSNIFSSSGGGRKNSHKSDGDSHQEDDETSVTSADNESQDESLDDEEDDGSSVYIEAAEAARRAVEGDDAKEDGSKNDRRESSVSVPGSIKSTKSSNSLRSTGHSRRRHLDSDDEDDAKVSSDIIGGLNARGNDSDSDDGLDAEDKHSSSEAKTNTDSKVDGDGNDMKVNSVHMQRSLDLWYGGGDDENGGMRAGRKTVARDTVAPEVIEVAKKEPTPPPTPPPPIEEQKPEPVVKSKRKKAERPATILPFTSLVCVPPSLKGSIDWGLPESYIQFTNFTTHGSWKMEIFWVDNEGAMVSRRELKSGLTHMDMCTADHVWAIIARPHYDSVVKPNGMLDASGSTLQQNSSLIVHDKSMTTLNENSTADHQKHNADLIDAKQPLIMVFRPCSMALQEGKCLSIIWTPWQSLSISHIIHPQTSKTRTKKPGAVGSTTDHHNSAERIQPVMHIQLFETPKQRLQAIAGQQNISNNADAASLENLYSNRDDQSIGSEGHMTDDLISAAGDGGSVHSHLSTLQSSVKSQHTTYSTIQRTLEDFKAAIKASDSRYQSKRDLYDTHHGLGKVQRKPLVTSGALHRMRKDHK